MQRYKFVEGVDEAWMEYDDHLPRDDQRAHVAEQSPLYLCSEVDAHLADMRAGFQVELASKDKWIDDLEQRMKRINAINDNPAVYNSEIDQLSSL